MRVVRTLLRALRRRFGRRRPVDVDGRAGAPTRNASALVVTRAAEGEPVVDFGRLTLDEERSLISAYSQYRRVVELTTTLSQGDADKAAFLGGFVDQSLRRGQRVASSIAARQASRDDDVPGRHP